MIERQIDIATADGPTTTFIVHTDRGFAFPQRPAYRKLAAEQHWERVLALFRRNLR